jgi:hypothetical protein
MYARPEILSVPHVHTQGVVLLEDCNGSVEAERLERATKRVIPLLPVFRFRCYGQIVLRRITIVRPGKVLPSLRSLGVIVGQAFHNPRKPVINGIRLRQRGYRSTKPVNIRISLVVFRIIVIRAILRPTHQHRHWSIGRIWQVVIHHQRRQRTQSRCVRIGSVQLPHASEHVVDYCCHSTIQVNRRRGCLQAAIVRRC